MDRGAWWATIHGNPKSQTWEWLNNNSRLMWWQKEQCLVSSGFYFYTCPNLPGNWNCSNERGSEAHQHRTRMAGVKPFPISPSTVQFSRVRLFATPWIVARQALLSITNSQSSLRLTSIESLMPSSHLILCRPLLLLPPIPPSIRVFSNELTLRMRWPKYCSFSFSIIPSKEIPGLISFRMDWLDLLTVQGTLKTLLQHHSSKASILRCSAFFTVQLSHPYMTTGKP